MRIMRGKYFEAPNGFWEKIEIELDRDDLTEDELRVPEHLRPQLLELRAEQHLLASLVRQGVMTQQEAIEKGRQLRDEIAALFPKKPQNPNRLPLK